MSLLASSALRSRARAVPRAALSVSQSSRQISRLSPKGVFFGGRRPFLSQFVSGLLFSAALTVPVSAFYHFSGMRNAVNTAQVTLAEINQARDKIKNVKEKPSDALYLLRIAAKSYVQGIPFAQWGVDKAFDSVEATIDAHQDEAKVIIEDLSRRMGAVIEKHKKITVPAAWELVKVVKEETGRLKEVAVEAVKEYPVAKRVRASGEGAGKVQEMGKGAVDFVKTKFHQRFQVDSEAEGTRENDTNPKS